MDDLVFMFFFGGGDAVEAMPVQNMASVCVFDLGGSFYYLKYFNKDFNMQLNIKTDFFSPMTGK